MFLICLLSFISLRNPWDYNPLPLRLQGGWRQPSTFSYIRLTSLQFVAVEVDQFAVDWYGVGRGDQNNRRISTQNPTDGERLASNSSRSSSLKQFSLIEKLDIVPQRAQPHSTAQYCSKVLSNCCDVRFSFNRFCLGIILCFSFI